MSNVRTFRLANLAFAILLVFLNEIVVASHSGPDSSGPAVDLDNNLYVADHTIASGASHYQKFGCSPRRGREDLRGSRRHSTEDHAPDGIKAELELDDDNYLVPRTGQAPDTDSDGTAREVSIRRESEQATQSFLYDVDKINGLPIKLTIGRRIYRFQNAIVDLPIGLRRKVGVFRYFADGKRTPFIAVFTRQGPTHHPALLKSGDDQEEFSGYIFEDEKGIVTFVVRRTATCLTNAKMVGPIDSVRLALFQGSVSYIQINNVFTIILMKQKAVGE